jgi:inner membrane protein
VLQKTHGVAALLATEIVILHAGVPILSWEAFTAMLIGCFAGPLADVDKPGSVMAKLFFPVSFLLRFLGVKHRTVTHSLLGMAVVFILAIPLPSLYFWSFVIGYATHPAIDLLNEQGVRLFWPLNLKVKLLPRIMAVETGSLVEKAFRSILGLACLLPIVRSFL